MADNLLSKIGGLLSDAAVKASLVGYDMVNDRQQMPSSQRVYLNTFLDNNKSKITEKDFTKGELANIMEIIRAKQLADPNATRGYITYKDYEKFVPKEQLTVNAGIKAGEKNPFENIRTTLGQFRYQVVPEMNRVFVIDNYDFNDVPAYKDDESGEYIGKDISKGRMLRAYGRRNMPEGKGRPVLVEIPGLLN
jgi:hypothetical protein